jgi:hypothetical protein
VSDPYAGVHQAVAKGMHALARPGSCFLEGAARSSSTWGIPTRQSPRHGRGTEVVQPDPTCAYRVRPLNVTQWLITILTQISKRASESPIPQG